MWADKIKEQFISMVEVRPSLTRGATKTETQPRVTVGMWMHYCTRAFFLRDALCLLSTYAANSMAAIL